MEGLQLNREGVSTYSGHCTRLENIRLDSRVHLFDKRMRRAMPKDGTPERFTLAHLSHHLAQS